MSSTLLQQLSEGNGMPYRDPRDPLMVETPESDGRALDQNRRERAQHLDALFDAGRIPSFEQKFLQWFIEDSALILFLSEPARTHGFRLVGSNGRLQ